MRFVMSCGNANVDIFMVVKEFPKVDQEVIARDLYVMMGGSAANFAVALSKLGTPTCFIGCVGDDELGTSFIKDLESSNVCSEFVVKVPGKGTGRVLILVKSSTGEKVMIAYRGANENLDVSLFPLELFERSRHFHLSSVPPEKALKFLKLARSRGSLTSYDPGGYATMGFKAFKDLLIYVDLLFLNKVETRAISGIHDLRASIKRLLEGGVKVVVVKLGKEGALASDGQSFYKSRAFEVAVVDTTGAGDAFNAGFVHGYLHGLSLEECLTLGNVVACLKITRRGARSSPMLSEVIKFMHNRGLSNIADKLKSRINYY